MNHCGDRPKRFAIGIAPLGIISIGVVPMGVVSIGVVPMGVVSFGVVGMGVISASVVGMGVLVGGLHTMGLWSAVPLGHRHQHPSAGAAQIAPAHSLAFRTKAEALLRARTIPCNGAHRMGALWMPCQVHH
ncbi:MAG: hypothetical protein RLZZ516_1701 [Cyanobacteriota bacterium]|jgi:hypothetical protein